MINTLPPHFCWTRFGTEAGELIDQIIARKEQERLNNNGLFFWGIGNALTPSMYQLLKLEQSPEVIFSPIISSPKQIDISPPSIVKWKSAQDLNNQPFILPVNINITSRATSPRHYALVCYSEQSLKLSMGQSFSINNLRNLLTNKQVGGSQVSAVVKYSDNEERGTQYYVALRAQLMAPFFIKLLDPEPLACH